MAKSIKPPYWDKNPDKPAFTRNIRKIIRLSRSNATKIFFLFPCDKAILIETERGIVDILWAPGNAPYL